jgi:hypothetical protein
VSHAGVAASKTLRLQAISNGSESKTVRARAENACAELSSLGYDRYPALGFAARDREATTMTLDVACRAPTIHIERRAGAMTAALWEIPPQ